MIEGVVNAALEAVIALPVSGPAGQTQEVEAVIDTGYSGFLTLPPALVRDLGLPFVTSGRATLANASGNSLDGSIATITADHTAASPASGPLSACKQPLC